MDFGSISSHLHQRKEAVALLSLLLATTAVCESAQGANSKGHLTAPTPATILVFVPGTLGSSLRVELPYGRDRVWGSVASDVIPSWIPGKDRLFGGSLARFADALEQGQPIEADDVLRTYSIAGLPLRDVYSTTLATLAEFTRDPSTGIERIIPFPYDWTASVWTSGRRLGDRLAKYPDHQFIVVGHSLGTLVTLAMAQSVPPDIRARIRALVLVKGPARGSAKAYQLFRDGTTDTLAIDLAKRNTDLQRIAFQSHSLWQMLPGDLQLGLDDGRLSPPISDPGAEAFWLDHFESLGIKGFQRSHAAARLREARDTHHRLYVDPKHDYPPLFFIVGLGHGPPNTLEYEAGDPQLASGDETVAFHRTMPASTWSYFAKMRARRLLQAPDGDLVLVFRQAPDGNLAMNFRPETITVSSAADEMRLLQEPKKQRLAVSEGDPLHPAPDNTIQTFSLAEYLGSRLAKGLPLDFPRAPASRAFYRFVGSRHDDAFVASESISALEEIIHFAPAAGEERVVGIPVFPLFSGPGLYRGSSTARALLVVPVKLDRDSPEIVLWMMGTELQSLLATERGELVLRWALLYSRLRDAALTIEGHGQRVVARLQLTFHLDEGTRDYTLFTERGSLGSVVRELARHTVSLMELLYRTPSLEWPLRGLHLDFFDVGIGWMNTLERPEDVAGMIWPLLEASRGNSLGAAPLSQLAEVAAFLAGLGTADLPNELLKIRAELGEEGFAVVMDEVTRRAPDFSGALILTRRELEDHPRLADWIRQAALNSRDPSWIAGWRPADRNTRTALAEAVVQAKPRIAARSLLNSSVFAELPEWARWVSDVVRQEPGAAANHILPRPAAMQAPKWEEWAAAAFVSATKEFCTYVAGRKRALELQGWEAMASRCATEHPRTCTSCYGILIPERLMYEHHDDWYAWTNGAFTRFSAEPDSDERSYLPIKHRPDGWEEWLEHFLEQEPEIEAYDWRGVLLSPAVLRDRTDLWWSWIERLLTEDPAVLVDRLVGSEALADLAPGHWTEMVRRLYADGDQRRRWHVEENLSDNCLAARRMPEFYRQHDAHPGKDCKKSPQ